MKRLILDGNRFGTKTAEGLGECVASHPNLQILSMRVSQSILNSPVSCMNDIIASGIFPTLKVPLPTYFLRCNRPIVCSLNCTWMYCVSFLFLWFIAYSRKECTILPSFVHELEALVRNQSLKVLSLNSCFGGCESDHIVKCIRMIAFYIGANQYLEKLYFSVSVTISILSWRIY